MHGIPFLPSFESSRFKATITIGKCSVFVICEIKMVSFQNTLIYFSKDTYKGLLAILILDLLLKYPTPLKNSYKVVFSLNGINIH